MKTGSLVVREVSSPSKKKKAALKKTAKKAAAKKRMQPKKQAKSTAAKKTTKKKKTVAKKSKKKTRSTAKVTAYKELQHLRRQPLGHLLVEKMLREEGFRGGLSSDQSILDKYSTDESIFSIRPQTVLQPRDQKDVETAVRVLGKETSRFPSLSLTPRAAGTGLSGGSLTDSIVIDVSAHLTDIGEIVTKKSGSTITVEPGALWKDVGRVLKKGGLHFPPYTASEDLSSVGGSIANNAAGPDSLRYGHCADWVESLNVTLYDGKTYTIKPINYKEFKALTKKGNALAIILEETLALLTKHEKTIQSARPKTHRSTAGFALWDLMDGSVASFNRGKAKLDLTRLISGSQGTLGVITSITLRVEPVSEETELIVVPVQDISAAGKIISKALHYDPLNIEFFDGLTFDLALDHPEFFKSKLRGLQYYKVLLNLYTLYHVRYRRQTPELTLLISIDHKRLKKTTASAVVLALKKLSNKRARLVTKPAEKALFWQLRRSSYELSKLADKSKRPAAFLEDVAVPPENFPKFFTDIRSLLKKYNVTATLHGHGGDGHIQFYPLLDFESKATPALIEKMAEEFFTTAIKHDGSICGEHNDGIIRTPHLNKMFNKTIMSLFATIEHIFDPDDIFNPGKKVNPRFDVKSSIRQSN